MSSNSHNFLQFTPNDQPLPNYYVSRNMAYPRWYDNRYSRNFYATATNNYMGYYYRITSENQLRINSQSQPNNHIDDNNPNLRGDVYNQATSKFRNYVASIKSKVEEFIGFMMKTRIHRATTDHDDDDDGGEICVICQCKYENDETIVTLKCQHEYHDSCLKQWLLNGKRCCPICRSSVLP
ncbi:hypothetical protein MTR67_005265 [Solanum verrucosum]|uniref:RING-type E3 ubiquitin transferase n=1 Tax=Solanum verrucosum TaxID=315347 RepID=A0AAF0PZ82_SOLVR|nr:hypothetical protein MTR67_005265 [Solanum verrucosum]